MFVDYFYSVYSNNSIDLDKNIFEYRFFDLPNNIFFSVDGVFNRHSCLLGLRSIGPDGISGELLFQLRLIIYYPPW